jgi:hypothetical protein
MDIFKGSHKIKKHQFSEFIVAAPFMVRHFQNPKSIVFQIPKNPSKTKHP